ncbi:uncharacterized protein METZ01_LOCUS485663 [marine metagenome]|uniref:Uncharacterized protein n=1 Tax=marine metagenome TaxID=408172 RepID=A0A383CL84_9ZZZZ
MKYQPDYYQFYSFLYIALEVYARFVDQKQYQQQELF